MSGSVGNRRPRSRARLLVVLVLVVLAGVFVLRGRAAAQAAFDAALTAHEAGDCRAAIEGYERSAGPWWTFTPLADEAERNAAQCQDYLSGQDAAAEQDHLAAVNAYESYLNQHPGSLLEQRAGDGRDAAFAALADEALAAADAVLAEGRPDGNGYREAIVLYLGVPSAYPDTPAAGRVPQALTAAFDRAAALAGEQRWCEAVGALQAFADATEPELAEVAGRATAALPQPLYECGLQRFAEGDADTALTHLRRLSGTYPADPLTAQARPTLIRAEVAAIGAAATGEVPPPDAVGRAPGGRVSVEVVNDSPDELEVLFAGPEADTVTIPACTTCSEYSFVGPIGGCVAGSLPTVSLDLAPGSYQLGVRSISGAGVVPYSGSWELAPGTAYSSCFFIVSSFG